MEESANLLKQKRKMKKLMDFKLSIPAETLKSLKKEAKVILGSKDLKSTWTKSKKKKKAIDGVKKATSNDARRNEPSINIAKNPNLSNSGQREEEDYTKSQQ